MSDTPRTVRLCIKLKTDGTVNVMDFPYPTRCAITGLSNHLPTCGEFELHPVGTRVAGPDDLLIRREDDGSWPDWVLVGLGWELDDSHDLSAVMDGVWRERPRAAAEGEET